MLKPPLGQGKELEHIKPLTINDDPIAAGLAESGDT
jgi:hypothetical protein